METISLLLEESDKLLILLARFSGLGFAPIFNARNVPALWKTAVVLLMVYFSWQIGLANNYQPPETLLKYVLVFLNEVIIGLLLSLIAQFFFAAINLAGQIIDTQMGFGIMNVVDPMSGTQAPLLGNFKFILAILVYLQIDGHHLFIKALIQTYDFIPIGHFSLQEPLIRLLITFFGNIFVTAIKLSFPIVASLIVTDVIMGIMSRTVPQMNIFMVGMPAKIILGFGILLVVVPLYIYLLNTLIAEMFKEIYQIVRVLR